METPNLGHITKEGLKKEKIIAGKKVKWLT